MQASYNPKLRLLNFKRYHVAAYNDRLVLDESLSLVLLSLQESIKFL